jgi:hypothetical protein
MILKIFIKMVTFKSLLAGFGALVVASIVLAVSFAIPGKGDKAKYEITSENGKRYYANSFRIYGKGIVFDDVYGRTVIVQGDLEIIAKKDENN